MVAIPVASDQPGVPRRLERIGVAEVVPVTKVRVKRLKQLSQKYSRIAVTENAPWNPEELAALHGLDDASSVIDKELYKDLRVSS